VLALAVVPAVWHVVDFEEEADPEFPKVERPTFNPLPPAAYRLAEPGDTIDRVAIYFSAAAIVFSVWGWTLSRFAGRPASLWSAAIALSLTACWHAATPGPTFDGWHGLGWRAIADGSAPVLLRLALGVVAIVLASIVARSVRDAWPRRAELLAGARERGCLGLLIAALVLVVARQFEIPGAEPLGYWPRWFYTWGLLAFLLALVLMLPPWPRGMFRRTSLAGAGALAWYGLVVGGIALTWYHRPLERLKTIVPDRIFISAMPTYRGLEIAHARHHFKTIINLFPEDTDERSPRWPQELKFVAEHGIRYLRSPTGATTADAFLDETLQIAQDPEAWPILVHCHGCMDRSPAWMGIYRFVVQARPLDEVMREIERHRGYRPKASVLLLYNRVLEPRAPARFAHDATAQKLKAYTAGTIDPYYAQLRSEAVQAQSEGSKPAQLRENVRNASRRTGTGVATQ
jgi:protein tyrosine phosphatase (PTP) superfamily phosphohydrolase (DUF442 family)